MPVLYIIVTKNAVKHTIYISRKEDGCMITFDTIAAKEFDNLIYDKNVLIIDLRDRCEYLKRHITGAINIPYDDSFDIGDISNRYVLVLYCERGNISLLAARQLSLEGYTVKSVIGGINAYRGKNITELSH